MKKIILSLLCGVMVLSVATGCDNNNQNSNNNLDNNDNNVNYELDFLEKHDLSDDYAGKIEDLLLYDDKLYVLIDNTIYDSNLSKITDVENNTTSIVYTYDYSALVQNQDGSYSFCDMYWPTSNNQNKQYCYNLKEKELFYALDGIASGFNVLVFNNKKLNMSSYDFITFNQTEKNKNVSVVIGEGRNKKYLENIKELYNFGTRDFYILTDKGDLYDTYGDGTISITDYILHLRNNPKLENVEKIYADSIKYGRPLHSVIGDNKNLYTYDSNVTYELGHPTKGQVKITMPNNYSLDDIKNIVFNRDILIEFNDGSIYIADKNDVQNLKLDENLTKINKEKKILDISYDHRDFVILMNNKTLYKLK